MTRRRIREIDVYCFTSRPGYFIVGETARFLLPQFTAAIHIE